MAEPERIILERAEDGESWRMLGEVADAEGHSTCKIKFSQEEDAEGHTFKVRLLSQDEEDTEGHSAIRIKFGLEPDGEDKDGQPLYRLSAQDAEGHSVKVKY